MKLSKETLFPVTAWAVDHDGKIKQVKITRVSFCWAYTSRKQQFRMTDLGATKAQAIKIAQREAHKHQKRANEYQYRVNARLAYIDQAKAAA